MRCAQEHGQQVVEPEHLLTGVMDTAEPVTSFVFRKLGVNAQMIRSVAARQIESLPRVSGGEPYLSRTTNRVLQTAVDTARRTGDEFTSIEAHSPAHG